MVSGINDYDGKAYNTQYRITSISGLKEFEVEPLKHPNQYGPGITTTGLGLAVCNPGSFSVVGPSYDIESFEYNKNVGLVTITTTYANEFRVNNGVRISGAKHKNFNGFFECVDKIGLTTVVLNVGIKTYTVSLDAYTDKQIRLHSGGMYVNGGDLVVGNGRLHGRETPIRMEYLQLFQQCNHK